MRKVVGSNPDDDLYRIVSFSFVDTSIEKRRLLRGNELERQQCDEAKQEVVRINLLQVDVAPSYNIVNIY